MKYNITISTYDLKILAESKATRKAAIKIMERVKWSKYGYDGKETTYSTHYYFEVDVKELERLIELISSDDESPLGYGLTTEFVVQLIKKYTKNEELRGGSDSAAHMKYRSMG